MLLPAQADELIFVPVMQTSFVSFIVSSVQFSCTHFSFQTATVSLPFLFYSSSL